VGALAREAKRPSSAPFAADYRGVTRPPAIPGAERRPEPYLAVDEERRSMPGGRRATDDRSHVREGLTGCRIIELPRVTDPRGNLTFIEGQEHVPFDIARAFYPYDLPGGEGRGGHAHRELEQFVIAASGSFEVLVDDGKHQERFFLSRAYYGLYVPRMIWQEVSNFSSGSVCLVLASHRYEEADYYRNYWDFAAAKAAEVNGAA
jgi:dTDP-4-dehydrorhamnose 3,5-epimerase-like enzyme